MKSLSWFATTVVAGLLIVALLDWLVRGFMFLFFLVFAAR